MVAKTDAIVNMFARNNHFHAIEMLYHNNIAESIGGNQSGPNSPFCEFKLTVWYGIAVCIVPVEINFMVHRWIPNNHSKDRPDLIFQLHGIDVCIHVPLYLIRAACTSDVEGLPF